MWANAVILLVTIFFAYLYFDFCRRHIASPFVYPPLEMICGSLLAGSVTLPLFFFNFFLEGYVFLWVFVLSISHCLLINSYKHI